MRMPSAVRESMPRKRHLHGGANLNLADAKRLAEQLMKTHNVSLAWSFRFDSAKVRFGKCDYRGREITLSRHLVELNDEAEVRDTILHEIAHALVRPNVGHGPAWQRVAQ